MAFDAETCALFREEVAENLAELDGALLELEMRPDDAEQVDRVFRAVHTLKGACDMFGICQVVGLAHDLESLFDHVRSGWRRINKPLLNAAFAAKDRFAAMLAEGADPAAEEDPQLAARLKELLRTPDEPGAVGTLSGRPESSAGTPTGQPEPPVAPQSTAEAEDAAENPSDDGEPCCWSIHLAPSEPGFLTRTDPLALLDEVRAMGQATVTCDLSGLPSLAALDPADCRLRFAVHLVPDPA
ncbi:MAG: Hpt domain-containing protein, partial [Acidobacteriota bacterium]